MNCLHLYIKGQFIAEHELSMPAYDDDLSFQDNCTIRTSYIDYERQNFRIRYLRQILKYQNDYDIFLVVQSKMNSLQHTFNKKTCNIVAIY